VTKIKHENYTGRWLSVFKAKWNPGRDDAFFVGSMQYPRRVYVYNNQFTYQIKILKRIKNIIVITTQQIFRFLV